MTNIKFTNARQAKAVYKYKNSKEKLCKTNAAVWLNKICKTERLTPNYIQVKVSGTSRQSIKTKNAIVF
jgi:hypothetical protein